MSDGQGASQGVYSVESESSEFAQAHPGEEWWCWSRAQRAVRLSEPDTFRIKIWTETGRAETIIYDNGMNQPIAGGNIVVHTKKN